MISSELISEVKTMNKEYIPLFSFPSYQYSVSLQGLSKIITMEYRSIDKSFRMSVFNPDNSPVVVGVKVVPMYPMLADYDLTAHGLTGYFLLEPKSAVGGSNIVIDDYETLAQKYNLCYMYAEEET